MKPIKVAILTTDKRDHDRNYAIRLPAFGTAPEALLQGLVNLPELEVHVVCCVQQPVTSPRKLAPNIFYHSLLVPKFGWMRTGYQGCIRAVRKKLQEIQPDIVHGQGTERDCAISAVFSGFPNLITLHGNMRKIASAKQASFFSYLWLAARLERFVLPRTDGVLCITSYTQKAVADLAHKTWIAPNAVDASFFDLQPAPDPTSPPVGLCVGTICTYKNQNDFIRALGGLAKHKKFEMLFAGQCDHTSYGDEFCRLIQKHPWCKHIGFIDREQLKARLRSASFLALPTLEDNCPMVVLEAMAAGVPVLASAIGGVPDLIQHEVNGLLCNPQRPETFREAVSRLLDDRQFANRLASEARAQALRRFHPKIIARRHAEIYHEVLGKKTET
ncbi:MAG TPA: glycosyltransferase family 4 protein [Candidatus Binatia bacterium]|nr:glycosyltransferase family 4 protein [Candidatus Binatia bacterium]